MSKLELLEKLSELEHNQWSHWIQYQLKVADELLWTRWVTLSNMPYFSLTEDQKDSDREWARKVLKIVAKWIVSHRHPMLPYENQEGYTKEEWIMREIARQCQIDELLEELGFPKFTAQE